jgi:AraC-like DNA-binding protein
MKEKLLLPARLDGRLWWYKQSGYGSPGDRHQPHRHDELEFNLVLQGRANYLLGRRRVELRRHSLIWLFPGQEHVLLDQSADYTMWIAVFRTELVRRLTRGWPDLRALRARRPDGPFCRMVAEPVAARLSSLLAETAAAADDDPPLGNAGLAYALLAAWAAYGREEPMPAGADVHPAVERVVRLLRVDNPAALALELPELAVQAGLSASRLSRLFHEQTGATLTAFRNRQRVQRFLQIYAGGRRHTLIAAALEAGFGSYPQFHRVFKQVTGSSPAAHKRNRP